MFIRTNSKEEELVDKGNEEDKPDDAENKMKRGRMVADSYVQCLQMKK